MLWEYQCQYSVLAILSLLFQVYFSFTFCSFVIFFVIFWWIFCTYKWWLFSKNFNKNFCRHCNLFRILMWFCTSYNMNWFDHFDRCIVGCYVVSFFILMMSVYSVLGTERVSTSCGCPHCYIKKDGVSWCHYARYVHNSTYDLNLIPIHMTPWILLCYLLLMHFELALHFIFPFIVVKVERL